MIALESEILEHPNFGLTEQKSLKIALEHCRMVGDDSKVVTGESVTENSLQIAKICIDEIGLSYESIVCVFLFPVIQNKLQDITWVIKNYGDEPANLIKGLSKIINFTPQKATNQAENYRNLMLNLAHDVRVILIKLAERLHTMRYMKHGEDEFQLKLGHEALYLYAPLAHRMGLYKVKSEMEDLALKFTEEEAYYDIAKKLQETAVERNKFIAEFIAPLNLKLKNEGIKVEIKGRPKSISSIWNKMSKNNISFDEVYDKFAIRIIIDTELEKEKSDCWRVYSIVTEQYQPNPRRLRDWISVPKTNGYESLHTTVVVSGGKWVEVQIRTIRMDEIAEKGFAAHWKYKEGEKASGLDDWLTKVREILEDPDNDTDDLVDDFKLALYSKEIFVFTPKGDLRKFPKGSTVLDFAFDIHSEVGAKCVGGKINDKYVSLRQVLQNGDKVEILTSKTQKPKLDWLNFVVTGKAKSKLKNVLNEAKRKDAEIGRDLVKRRFKNWKLNFQDTNINKLLKYYKLKNSMELYYQIAIEKINISEIKDILITEEKKAAVVENQIDQIVEEDVYTGDDTLVIDNRLDKMDYKLAKCCNPIFGDNIFGFVTIGEGIKIHRVNCPNAPNMLSRYDYRVVKAKWKESSDDTSYYASINLNGYDELGLFTSISEMIGADPNMSMRSINLDTNDGMFEGKLKVTVKDKKHLDGLLKRLLQIKGVLKASRIDN